MVKSHINEIAYNKSASEVIVKEPVHTVGVKYDKGKIKADLVMGDFANALTEVCQVGTFGAEKYTESGWLHVPGAMKRYKDAMMRHWLAMKRGEECDDESGERHMAHFAWNVLAILELEARAK